MEHPFDLTGKRALVTGAGRGIGRAVARALAAAGAEVMLSGRDEAGLGRTAAEVRALGREAQVVSADLAAPGGAQRLANEALGRWPVVDILVNNAGVSYPESALQTSEAHWDVTLAVNAKAAFFLAQRLAEPMLAQRWGRVVNISSQAGLVGLEHHAAYCASKWALEGLSRVLAIEWAPYGVTVNCVAPTVVNTEMARQAFDSEEKRQGMLSRIPLGRFGEPEEVAAAVVYLASEAAGLVTGDTLRCDGGWTAR